MPRFDIVKATTPSQSFRVSKVMSDFDVKAEHAQENFTGEIQYPEQWSIGAIVGGSGTGKSTIAKYLYGTDYINGFVYNGKSVIDDMPQASVEEITRMFYAVGFGSVPSWLKPYEVLSNGEKMRVDLARALLERDFIVFDEFTSVVDRNVARTSCIAINKAIHKTKKKFIAISCHYDILEWLQPDWVLDTNTMKCFFMTSRAPKKNLQLKDVSAASGRNLSVITI